MLHCLTENMKLFWEWATSDLPSLMESLNESNVPKKAFKPGLETDSIEKCLWILCKCHHDKTICCLFQVIEAISDCAFRNTISHVDLC